MYSSHFQLVEEFFIYKTESNFRPPSQKKISLDCHIVMFSYGIIRFVGDVFTYLYQKVTEVWKRNSIRYSEIQSFPITIRVVRGDGMRARVVENLVNITTLKVDIVFDPPPISDAVEIEFGLGFQKAKGMLPVLKYIGRISKFLPVHPEHALICDSFLEEVEYFCSAFDKCSKGGEGTSSSPLNDEEDSERDYCLRKMSSFVERVVSHLPPLTSPSPFIDSFDAMTFSDAAAYSCIQWVVEKGELGDMSHGDEASSFDRWWKSVSSEMGNFLSDYGMEGVSCVPDEESEVEVEAGEEEGEEEGEEKEIPKTMQDKKEE